jgi:hypothetical protein
MNVLGRNQRRNITFIRHPRRATSLSSSRDSSDPGAPAARYCPRNGYDTNYDARSVADERHCDTNSIDSLRYQNVDDS